MPDDVKPGRRASRGHGTHWAAARLLDQHHGIPRPLADGHKQVTAKCDGGILITLLYST
jgi:hypothetical protein